MPNQDVVCIVFFLMCLVLFFEKRDRFEEFRVDEENFCFREFFVFYDSLI